MSRFRIRALQPFRIRNRYIRGSTSRNGHTLPLTSIDVAEVLADPGRAGDVAGRVEERPVGVELPVLDDQRDLVGPAGDPDRVGLCAGVELVAEDVGGGEPGEDIQARRPEAVVVEPQQRGRHLRRLVRVEDASASRPAPNPFGVTAGLPSLSAATKPPCRWVISRTSLPSGVSRVSTGSQRG